MKHAPVLLLLLSLPLLAQERPGTEIERTVWQLEQRRVQSLITADWPEVEKLLSQHLVYTHSNGQVETKQQFLRSVRGGRLVYHSMQHEDVVVRDIGGAVLLTGRTRVEVQPRGGERQPLELRFIAVWGNEAGWWRLVAWQSTRMPEAEKPAAKEGTRE